MLPTRLKTSSARQVCHYSTRRSWLGITALFAMSAIIALLVFWRSLSAPGTPVVINETAVPPVPTLDPSLVAQGEAVYVQYCAACHGANLEGASDWKHPAPDGAFPPPPHDSSGHTWHHADRLLLSLIANGGDPAYNSKMPAFQDKLMQTEMTAVLEFIKSKWGKNEREFQWWVTATSK